MSQFISSLNQNAERWALLFFYVLLVTTMFIEVLRREIFSYSSIWGEELVRYSFIYLAWIGAASAVREQCAYSDRRVNALLISTREGAGLYFRRPCDVGGRSDRCLLVF